MSEMLNFIVEKLSDVLIYYYSLTGNYGISLFLLSLSCSIIINILNNFFKRYTLGEIEIQKIINPQIKKIKEQDQGEKRHKRIQNLYYRYSYNPIFSFRLLIPFIIQLPFLISVYFMLLDFKPIKGKILWLIQDLSSPDKLIFDINILPILMSVLIIFLANFSKEINSKQKYQSYFISLFFLIILYNTPSSLILFWIFNSLILFIFKVRYFNKLKINWFLNPFSKYVKTKLINELSITLLLLPYFIIKKEDEFFTNSLLLPSIILFLILDAFLIKINKYIRIALYVFSISFFYSLIFYNDTIYLYHSLRFRYFIIFILLSSIFITLIINYYKKERFLNLFFIVFSFIILFNGTDVIENNSKNLFKKLKLKTSPIKFQLPESNENKPLILIIIDELAPSKEVFKFTNSEKDFEFDNFLKKQDFILRPNFKSLSQQTKVSLTSMFNFNLKESKWIQDFEINNNQFSTTPEFNVLFKGNLLIDSLSKKGIKSYSFGKVNFNLGSNYNKDIFYNWENIGFNRFNYLFQENEIFKSFFKKSILSFIDSKLYTNHPIDFERKQIFELLSSISPKKNSFYYFHLDAPHQPFSYFDEFPLIEVNLYEINDDYDSSKKYENDLYKMSYSKYRRFIIKKVTSILKSEKFKDCKIIIVGDHGLRNTSGFDPFSTIGAFYGFKIEDIMKLNEVQDIGSLINHNFN